MRPRPYRPRGPSYLQSKRWPVRLRNGHTGGHMFEVRIHGRGGQGVVTAAEMLAVAGFKEGKYAQAFPSFGSERMGAPVVAFCRLDDKPIRSREPIASPDALIIQDPTLLHSPGVFAGLKPGGYVLINSSKRIEELGLNDQRELPEGHVQLLPATEIALEFLGRPIPNAILLGAFSALTGVVNLEAVLASIAERFTGATAEKNSRAAQVGYETVLSEARLEVPA